MLLPKHDDTLKMTPTLICFFFACTSRQLRLAIKTIDWRKSFSQFSNLNSIESHVLSLKFLWWNPKRLWIFGIHNLEFIICIKVWQIIATFEELWCRWPPSWIFFQRGTMGILVKIFSVQNTFFLLVYRENASSSYKISILDTFIVLTKGLNIHKLATNNYI